MKWKQFFTPVSSVAWDEAKKIMDAENPEDVILLDVRQPKEYEQAHIPGATLIPLAELDKRVDELDKDKPIVVYCAIGGRSRVAAQMLSGMGFSKLYNLSGGINGWESEIAIGPQDSGVALYDGVASVEEAIIIGFGVEEGLREFYLGMLEHIEDEEAKNMFTLLADIEIEHQKRLVELYTEVTGKKAEFDDFASGIAVPAMEGGISTEEYIKMFNPDLNRVVDILSLAMSIEAQAFDLYTRAAAKSDDELLKTALFQIASEERMHMQRIAEYLEEKV